MIRSAYRLVVLPNEQEYDALKQFLGALGLASGEAWEGSRSKGAKFSATEAGIELGFGEGFPQADVVLEAASADEVYELARKREARILEDIRDTEWGSRMFTLEAPGGLRLAVFSYQHLPAHRRALEGKLNAEGLRVAIVVARFNAFITEKLLAGALDGLRRSGASERDIRVAHVPGSFEIPAAARTLAESGDYDAIVCIGCLLRGDTLHYEVIANEVARGVGQSAQETGVPHAFGVLTCDTLEQAIDRSGLKAGNKGYEAALSAIEMANLNRAIAGKQGVPVAKSIQT
ncbi:MAG: 6,7-dimethyl-8-ribityllumazine synthase [Candidatus Korobacteraceae bacterium]